MSTNPRGRVAVIGCGPAGMAATLSIAQAGHDVTLIERYPSAKPAGIVLNLWPPPVKALGLMGVDTEDLGSPTISEFRNSKGGVRARVNLPEEIVRDYGGGFLGLLRPGFYRRLLDALPEGSLRVNTTVTAIDQDEQSVRLTFADGSSEDFDVLVGADGIDSLVCRTLWGESPKREHNLHVIAGYTFEQPAGAEPGYSVLGHNRTVQGSWTSIRHDGRTGYQWWTLTKHDGTQDFTGDLLTEAARLAVGFPDPLPGLIAATAPENVQRWVLRDRKPLDQWSKGRATIIGDAAHPTSPYAAYGAGMATEDGYFLGRRLAGVDLSDYQAVRDALQEFEEPRKPHTKFQVNQAWMLGKIFHHAPKPLRPVRDLIFDRTPFLQKQVGETSPKEILEQLQRIDEVEADFTRRMSA